MQREGRVERQRRACELCRAARAPRRSRGRRRRARRPDRPCPPRRITTTRSGCARRAAAPARLSVAHGASDAGARARRARGGGADREDVGDEVGDDHGSFLSAALELGRHQQQREGLRPSAARSICVRVLVAQQRAEACAASARASTRRAEALGQARRPLDALPDRVRPQPVFGVVGPAGGRGRGVRALAQRADAERRLPTRCARTRARSSRSTRADEMTNSSGVFSLAGCGSQASGCAISSR